jgi:ElaB/YqjD/DUF883 family membrane-anchored ribosome-binding protein
MNTQELVTKMEELLEVVKSENAKTAKAAHGRARKTLGEIKKLVSEYRKASIEEDKK